MSQPAVDATDSVPEPSISKTTRHRLNVHGTQILEEYWHRNPGKMPSSGERHALTTKIKSTPGNEYYRYIHTTSWFKRRIEKLQDAPAINPEFPTLNRAVLDFLEVLLKNQPNPPSALVQTWASMLANQGAAYQDVVNWVNIMGSTRTTASTRLPTPADTASPSHSPSLSPSLPINYTENHNTNQSMKRDPMLSPVLPPLAIATADQREGVYVQSHQASNRYSPFTPVSATFSPLLSSALSVTPVPPVQNAVSTFPTRTHASGLSNKDNSLTSDSTPLQQQQPQQPRRQAQSKHPNVPILNAIIQGVVDAISTPDTPTTTAPSSAAEFNEMFSHYEKQMAQLMQSLEHS